jgi:hypothetical protein
MEKLRRSDGESVGKKFLIRPAKNTHDSPTSLNFPAIHPDYGFGNEG